MAMRQTNGVDGRQRTWNLRREWNRAFIIMLVLLLVASIATFAFVHQLVDRFSGTARELDGEATIAASLDTAITDHEGAADQLLRGATVDVAAFLSQQDDISRLFDEAPLGFPDDGLQAIVLAQSAGAWQGSLSKLGLWGDQVRTFTPPPYADQAQSEAALAADSNAARRFLLALQGPSLIEMHKSLAADARLERLLMAGLSGVYLLAVAVTLYFRKRMARDLVRPVANLHEGVLKLQAGEYEHRIAVSRRDELGELAEAFNGMAGALHDSHMALTLRATHDSLTGLPNRASLTDRLKATFLESGYRRDIQHSVLFIDIDDFKDVNDSMGHEGGDELLIQLAARLSHCVRPPDLVSRLGGDEFAVVVEGNDESIAVVMAERILAALRAPFVINGSRLTVAVSIGIAHRHASTIDAAELLRQADFAMYMAKGAGKDRYQLFDARMHDDMVGRTALKADLAVAVTSGQLRLDYQPVADLRTGEVVGVEALVRWQHPTLGLLAPGEFIPLAEETGDIEAIGCWVLQTAVHQVARWRQTMAQCADLWVSVNLSAFQLPSAHSRAAIEAILADPSSQADKVILEVTETALAADVHGGLASINAWKQYGVRIAIDDFGTGFSSLSTLAGLPIDILKIDRSFVSGQSSITPSVPMLEGILGLATKLSLNVIAEGIEDAEQAHLLRILGCQLGQGYLLARPTSATDVEALLAAGGLLPVPLAAP